MNIFELSIVCRTSHSAPFSVDIVVHVYNVRFLSEVFFFSVNVKD